MQQTTLETSRQNSKQSIYMKVELLNQVENFVAKGEIAHCEQFLLWLQCFQQLFSAYMC